MARYELTDFEWQIIQPLLSNKPRGVTRVDNRRVMNGIFRIVRSGRPSGAIWPLHDRLQSLQPLAKGGRLGPPDGCGERSP